MKKIAIIPNDIKDTGLIQTKRIIDCLSGRVKLYMPSNYSVVGGNINYVTLAELYASADAAIVLGGDGTILQRAAECAKRKLKNIFSVPRIPSGEGYFRLTAFGTYENSLKALDRIRNI